jgi:HAMP domain-containing protein
MKLLVKFNLVLFLVFGIGFVATGYFCNKVLQQNAKTEVEENARIVMESALAVRNYTATEIKPLLETQIKYNFLPQMVSAYSANAYFRTLQKKFPEYTYKEATLNPTNPVDRAVDWEADIVNEFRKTPDRAEIVVERDTPTGRYMYMARPLKIPLAACLTCHDTPEGAPATVIAKYGSANGFGWKLNDIVGAQIVSVPSRLPLQRAYGAFVAFMSSLAAIFVLLALAINALLILLVIRPVKRLSSMATKVSLGKLDAGEFQIAGKDEIAELSHSFDRMKKSLVEAMNMLGT